MQIALLFLVGIVSLGNSKKSHTKSVGYLIHKKGPKKSATYLKIKTSHRKPDYRKPKANLTMHEVEPRKHGVDYNLKMKKSHRKPSQVPRLTWEVREADYRKPKANLTSHEVEGKKQAADYNHINSRVTWKEKEKWLMGMWDTAWEELYGDKKKWRETENGRKMLKPLSEAGEDPNIEVDKWITDWDLLMHAISELSETTSTNEAEVEAEHKTTKYDKLTNQLTNQVFSSQHMGFFIHPKHRRPGLKWIQTTKETHEVFLVHKLDEYLESSIDKVKEKSSKSSSRSRISRRKVEKQCNDTSSCFLWTPQPTQATQTTLSTVPFDVQATATQPPQNFSPPWRSRRVPPPDIQESVLINDQTTREFLNKFLRRNLRELQKTHAFRRKPGEDYATLSELTFWPCQPNER